MWFLLVHFVWLGFFLQCFCIIILPFVESLYSKFMRGLKIFKQEKACLETEGGVIYIYPSIVE